MTFAFLVSALVLFPLFVLAESGTRPKSMNPDMSVNVLMLGTNSSRGNYIDSSERNGFSLQEAEMQFYSDVDPYSKLNALFSVHQDPPTGGAREGEWKIEPEEVFVDTTTLPVVGIRAGKFKSAIGRHNTLHTHAYPFIDAPMTNQVLLGVEGYSDVGLSASALVPVSWFSEVTAQVFSGRSGSADAGGTYDYFNAKSTNTSVLVGHYKNLYDFSDSLTGELGLSGATGANEFKDAAGVSQPGATVFYGADLTFKWRPMSGGKSQAFAWSTEYLNRHIGRPTSANQGDGFASWVQYQIAERWWVQVRGDYLQVKDDDATAPLAIAPFSRKYTALIGFFPSEFSGFRFQYSHQVDDRVEPEKKFYVQMNFTIGAHPAHSY